MVQATTIMHSWIAFDSMYMPTETSFSIIRYHLFIMLHVLHTTAEMGIWDGMETLGNEYATFRDEVDATLVSTKYNNERRGE